MDLNKLRTVYPEFADLLKKAIDTGEPVNVTIDGRAYTLTITPTREYDPERVRKALDDVTGMFSDEKVDAMINRLYGAREVGSRPIDRP